MLWERWTRAHAEWWAIDERMQKWESKTFQGLSHNVTCWHIYLEEVLCHRKLFWLLSWIHCVIHPLIFFSDLNFSALWWIKRKLNRFSSVVPNFDIRGLIKMVFCLNCMSVMVRFYTSVNLTSLKVLFKKIKQHDVIVRIKIVVKLLSLITLNFKDMQ